MGRKYPSRILVVEDNQDHLVLIKNILDRWAEESRTEVETASSVAEALEKLSATHFDLVLTDYRLPDQTGLDLLTEVKTRNYNFPVLLMTAAGDEHLAVNALKSGFVDYIVKSETSFRDLPHIIETAYDRFRSQEREKKLQEEI